MRIILSMILLLFPFIEPVEANGVDETNYKFYVIPTTNPEKVEFEIHLSNEGNFPLHFQFPTSQYYELTVTDQSGKEVYVYSKGRYFLQAFQTITIEPQQAFTITEKWNYQFKGNRVPSGEYTVQVTLKPISVNDEPIKDRKKLSSRQPFFVPEINPLFRHVLVSGTNGDYVITGETRSDNGHFYYSVEDGHEEYISDKQVQTKESNEEWKPFEFPLKIQNDKLSKNGSFILNLFQQNEKGEIIHSFPIPLKK